MSSSKLWISFLCTAIVSAALSGLVVWKYLYANLLAQSVHLVALVDVKQRPVLIRTSLGDGISSSKFTGIEIRIAWKGDGTDVRSATVEKSVFRAGDLDSFSAWNLPLDAAGELAREKVQSEPWNITMPSGH